MTDVGKKIQRLRKEKGLTLIELGDKINFNYSNLSKVERGERKPTLELLELVANFFDVKLSYFFGELQSNEDYKDYLLDDDWVAFKEEMEEYGLTPEEIKDMIGGFLKRLKGNKD